MKKIGSWPVEIFVIGMILAIIVTIIIEKAR